MDLSSVMTTLLSSDSVNNLSKKTGSSKKEVTSVLTSALPLLLEGATGQAKDESTAESFAKALVKHSAGDTSNIADFLDGVDMADGAKIIGHLLGSKTESATKKVSKSSGTSDDSTAQILAAAAPLLMSLLGQETKKSKKNSSNELVGELVTSVLENVDVGSLLAGMLTSGEEKTTKKTTAKKATTTKKSTTAKKATISQKTTTKKKAASTAKKKAASDSGIDIGDVADILTKILK